MANKEMDSNKIITPVLARFLLTLMCTSSEIKYHTGTC